MWVYGDPLRRRSRKTEAGVNKADGQGTTVGQKEKEDDATRVVAVLLIRHPLGAG
jgi:hypothetical protein